MPRSETLRPRKLPAQARAIETVDAILDAAAALLVETGVEGASTNAIAERAGVNVASLYSYFPNKYSVLAALCDRMQTRQRGLWSELDADRSLESVIDSAVDETFAFVLREPGFVELADAVRMVPELRELGQQAHAQAAVALRERMAARGGSLPGTAELETRAAVIVETASAVLALARRSTPRRRKHVIGALKELLVS